MSDEIAFVTGGNRGLGLALVRRLAAELDGGTIYLTARDEAAGRAAAERLGAEEGARSQVVFHALDISSDASVEAFAGHIARTHGGVDIVIQNAAMAPLPDVPASETAAAMIDTNNHGTYRILSAFRPLLREGARVVVVASGFGTLAGLDPRLHDRFDVDTLSMEDIERTMDGYVASARGGTAEAEGWPDWVNVPSKIGQVALTKVFARVLREDPDAPRDVVVNAACPGWTVTDASRPYLARMPHIAAKSPDEAAGDVIWLATPGADTDRPYGELVKYRQVVPFRPEGTPAPGGA